MESNQSDASKSFSPSPYIVAGYATIILAFGVFGTWAATAPLASGGVASGTVSVQSNRKVVQHLEGGIVEEILVQEGEVVDAGDVLVRLDQTQAQGNYAVLSSRLAILKATEARLQAESVDADTVEFPEEIMAASGNPEPPYITLQRRIFEDRKATKEGEIKILRVRIEQLQEEIAGLQVQHEALEKQHDSLTEEIDRLTEGQKGGFVSTNQLSQITRTRMELTGTIGQVVAQIAKIKQSIAETELQILQTGQAFMERAGAELREIRDQLNEVSERVMQARDVLQRTVVRSPVHGMVQDIQIHTESGIIRPAEPIMDIIPLNDDLVVNARVRPLDVDMVSVGSRAEVRFPSFSSRTTPVIFGTVTMLSTDVIQPADENIDPYYMAKVQVNEKDVPANIKGRLMPGMPADVIIQAGERTLFQYLMKPLTDAFSKGLLEQ
jgi:HlyD family type I secretion membrane fusion protein